MKKLSSRSGWWFNPKSLQSLCDIRSYRAGMGLYYSDNVLDMTVAPLHGGWLVEGEVLDSKKDTCAVSIEMALNPDGEVAEWDSNCTCPVGYQCKHGVALMFRAAHEGLAQQVPRVAVIPPTPEERQTAEKTEQARREEIAAREAEIQLLRWLQALDQASGEPAQAADAASGKARQEHYVYLLSVASSASHKGHLKFEPAVSYRKKSDGQWAKPKILKSLPGRGHAAYEQATEVDRQVLQLLHALPSDSASYYHFSAGVIPEGQAGLMVLELAASTGRLFLSEDDGTPGRSIEWGAPRSLEWSWKKAKGPRGTEPDWALRATLAHTGPAGRGSSVTLCLNNPPLYLDREQGRCGPVQAEGIPQGQLDLLLKAPPMQAATLEKHQAHLVQRLGPLPLPPMLHMARIEGVRPRACLRLTPSAPGQIALHGLMQAQLSFDYQGHRGWWTGQPAAVLVESPQGRVLLQRDLPAEQDAIARLAALGLPSAGAGRFGTPGQPSQQEWLDWIDHDFSILREAGFEVSADSALNGWISRADTLSVDLQPQEDADGDDGESGPISPWFDLSLGMEINGQRHNILPWLPELIATAAGSPADAATGQPVIPPFIYLHDPKGTGFIRLPTDALKPWMAALLELVGDRSHDFSGSSLKLSRLDALRTGAALGAGAVWSGADALHAMVQQLSGHAQLPEISVPASLQASLRPYQQHGLNWLQFLGRHGLGGILADDMGLGKTLQTLAHVLVEKEAGRLTRPALVVAPVSLMGNWRREAERFTPTLRTLVLHGKERHESAGQMAAHDLVIVPYSLLQRDRERWLEQPWHLVVLDEAQNIKNASTHTAQVVGELNTRHRLCLSGTPMENHLGELWSLFHFLMPGFLGSQTRFRQLFRTPIEKLGDSGRLAQLRSRITPFMLRRTKSEVATELPDKIESVTRIELSGKQADLYETIRLSTEKAVREALAEKGLARAQIQILDALLKLRQVCCDPRLVPLDSARKVTQSAKLEHLMTVLPEMLAAGRRVLLFSQFTSMLALIEEALQAQGGLTWAKLTGQSQKRDEIIERFTSGQVPLFLISLKAGGTGLNLPQADTVIHYDPWWNPAVEDQATGRAHRIGQKNQVFVYKLVAQGTIEERILALQERKAALAESMYSGSVARREPLFTESDVAELLRPLG
ncbi:MAG: DEAD/DEAH box helicase [Burkholderiales bacterium]|nr:DEAD/DEAH box helicase [Burkholderiales bacterium]